MNTVDVLKEQGTKETKSITVKRKYSANKKNDEVLIKPLQNFDFKSLVYTRPDYSSKNSTEELYL